MMFALAIVAETAISMGGMVSLGNITAPMTHLGKKVVTHIMEDYVNVIDRFKR